MEVDIGANVYGGRRWDGQSIECRTFRRANGFSSFEDGRDVEDCVVLGWGAAFHGSALPQFERQDSFLVSREGETWT